MSLYNKVLFHEDLTMKARLTNLSKKTASTLLVAGFFGVVTNNFHVSLKGGNYEEEAVESKRYSTLFKTTTEYSFDSNDDGIIDSRKYVHASHTPIVYI